MLQITKDQARQRLKTLPEELRDFVFDAEISELIEKIGEKNHLDDDKQKALAKVVSYVLLGFLHQEDCRKEIQERLGVNPMVANELQNILIRDIFARVSQHLEKSYSPTPKNVPIAGQTIDSVVPSKPISIDSMPKPAPLPVIAPASLSAAAAPSPEPIKKSPLVFTGSPIPSSSTNQTPAAPKPMPFVTQTNSQSAPVGNVPKFKIETPGTLSGSAFGGSNTPSFSSAPRPAKIELGFSTQEKKAAPTPSTTFETQKSSVRYGAPMTPSFSGQPLPPPIKPNVPNPETKEEIVPPVKKIEVTVSGLKIPPTPPKIEPPKPLL